MTYRGWICATGQGDRARLEALGVKVGEWSAAEGAFVGCEVVDMAALDASWGEFMWGLEEVREEGA